MKNNIILDQLKQLKDVDFYINDEKIFLDNIKDFDEIIICKKNNSYNQVLFKITFQDYFIDKKYKEFTFHEKFNNGVIPYAKVMIGDILKQTDKMIYFRGHADNSQKIYEGWVPKKSCMIERIY